MAWNWRHHRIYVISCDAEVRERVHNHNNFEQSFFPFQRLTYNIDSSQNYDGLITEIEVKDEENKAYCP